MNHSKKEDNITLEGVAIIGMSCSFPKANDLEEFWSILREGKNCITTYSEEDLLQAEIDPALLKDSHYVKAKGALENIDLFDAEFFEIGPREAELMDPQHRLLLECAWSALEHSGYDPEAYKGLIGIYAGESMSSYAYLNVLPTLSALLSTRSLQAAIGNDKDSLTTTISYHLDLRGPAITVQSSSSTSLTAISLACQQLLSYQCDMALAGGVSAGPPIHSGYLYEEGGISSSDGVCRSFDKKSNGFVPGSGVGLVVLKRLSEAVKDRDSIWAVIKGCSINNDGNKKVSYSSPSVDAQAEVIRMALEYAEFDPETISYIEAHGTGTKLGDPVEIAALTQAFRAKTKKKNFCGVGSVKSNIGHLDTAAGVAGLIKTVLCLKHRTLVPSLHFESPNPELNLENSPFYICTKSTEWKSLQGPLRAGVTSLGMGGTNSHVVLEESLNYFGESISEKNNQVPILITLSAKTPTALHQQIHNLNEYLVKNEKIPLSDIGYTLNIGRRPMKYRSTFVVGSKQELIHSLENVLSTGSHSQKAVSRSKIVFVYGGSYSKDSDLPQSLYKTYSIFKNAVDVCVRYIYKIAKVDLTPFFVQTQSRTDAYRALPEETFQQTMEFIFEYALASLWIYWGVYPEAQIGLRNGEIVAAVIAKIMSVEMGLDLILQPHQSVSHFQSSHLDSPKIPLISSLTGTWLTTEEAHSTTYWTSFGTRSDQLKKGLTTIQGGYETLFINIGFLHTCFPCDKEEEIIPFIDRLTSNQSASNTNLKQLFETIRKVYEKGVLIDWTHFYADEHRFKIPLPTYPFERKRYWIETNQSIPKHPQNPTLQTKQQTFQPRPSMNTPYEIPRNEYEIQLAQLWENALGLKPIGINDNFFDLGGCSLEATTLLSSMNAQFKKKIALKDFYSSPTIKEIASLINENPSLDFEALLDEISRK